MSCASVINGPTKKVQIASSPSSEVTITNRDGEVLTTQTTPTIVDLKRSSTSFKPEKYLLTFQKDGYLKGASTLEFGLNGMLFGNIILGGPLGLLIDGATGAMWNSPDRVDFNMVPITK